jgi:hypothetical protein
MLPYYVKSLIPNPHLPSINNLALLRPLASHTLIPRVRQPWAATAALRDHAIRVNAGATLI